MRLVSCIVGEEEKSCTPKKCIHFLTINHTRHRSELHLYRGLEGAGDVGQIMGHEFTGHVVQVGEAVKTVAVGDQIVCPFTTSWYFFTAAMPPLLPL